MSCMCFWPRFSSDLSIKRARSSSSGPATAPRFQEEGTHQTLLWTSQRLGGMPQRVLGPLQPQVPLLACVCDMAPTRRHREVASIASAALVPLSVTSQGRPRSVPQHENAACACVMLGTTTNRCLWLQSACNYSCQVLQARPEHRLSAVTPSLPILKKLFASDAIVGIHLKTECHSRISRATFHVCVCLFTSLMADSATPVVACFLTGLTRNTNSTNGLPTKLQF